MGKKCKNLIHACCQTCPTTGALFSFLLYIILYLKYKIMWATSDNNNQRGSITIIATE